VTKNGDRFFIFIEDVNLVTAKLTREKYEEVSRTKLIDAVGVGLGHKVVWSHPAYANKCVYARNDREIDCVDLVE
jgi:outer membrane protein assembly factor BamB